MTFKLNKLAALVGVTLGALASSSSFAAVEGSAQSVRQLNNFGLYNYNGGGVATILNAATDFTAFVATDDASVSATLNGVTSQLALSGLAPVPPTDLLQHSVGVNPYGENNFSNHAAVPVGTFSRADHQLSGVLVAGLGASTPASSRLVSEVNIQGTGSGTSNTTSGTGGTVVFTPAKDGIQVLIDFDAINFLQAYVTPALSARASSSLSFSLINGITGDVVFEWAPNGILGGITGGTELNDPCNLNTTLNANVITNGPLTRSCTGRFRAFTDPLLAGVPYALTFSETTTANATVIPEPGSLALAGLALTGLGLARRRARRA